MRGNKIKSYFQFVICEDFAFHKLDYFDVAVPNLYLFLSNRMKQNIIYLSSNILKLIVAYKGGFSPLPVVNSAQSREFELHLLEKYFMNIKNQNDFMQRYLNDFSYLTSSPEIQHYQNIIRKSMKAENEEEKDIVSSQSFG